MLFFQKKASGDELTETQKHSLEEIGEKKTSLLGYILLIFMTIFLISAGETVFSDLENIPNLPNRPSSCLSLTKHSLENMRSLPCSKGSRSYSDSTNDVEYYEDEYSSQYQKTQFPNSTDRKFLLDQGYTALVPSFEEIVSLNLAIQSNTIQIQSLESSLDELNTDYDISLQEKMAGEIGINDKPTIQNTITSSRDQVNTLRTKSASLTKERDTIIANIMNQVTQLKNAYEKAFNDHMTHLAWYKFKVFLLTLLFILPFFALSLRYYLRFKQANSPYTIILTATTVAFSFLFLQVVGTFLYDILPKEWFARIFRFFIEIPAFRYIIYYGSIILIIGIFGGIVFFIQKRVFNAMKVASRRLRDKKCPKCSFPIDPAANFCSDCGIQLREACTSCGNARSIFLSHCPACGKTNAENSSMQEIFPQQ